MTPEEKVAHEARQLWEPSGPGDGLTAQLRQQSIEREIALAWQTILGVAEVGIDDNFFDLGGSSLAIIRFLSWAMDTYRVEIPLTSFFEQPTVAQMAILIAGLETLTTAGG